MCVFFFFFNFYSNWFGYCFNYIKCVYDIFGVYTPKMYSIHALRCVELTNRVKKEHYLVFDMCLNFIRLLFDFECLYMRYLFLDFWFRMSIVVFGLKCVWLWLLRTIFVIIGVYHQFQMHKHYSFCVLKTNIVIKMYSCI